MKHHSYNINRARGESLLVSAITIIHSILKGKTKAQTHAIKMVQNGTIVQKVARRARDLQTNSTQIVFPTS